MRANHSKVEDINAILHRLQQFCQSLQLDDHLDPDWANERFTLLSREGSTLILTGRDAEIYSALVDELYEAMIKRPRAISKRVVSGLVSEFVTKAATSRHLSAPELSKVSSEALRALKEALFAPEHHWRLVSPVGGLAPSGLPAQVGGVEFKLADDTFISAIGSDAVPLLEDSRIPDQATQAPKHVFTEHLDAFRNSTVAVLGAKAVDCDAAFSLVTKKLRMTVDCINFYVGRAPWNMWAYLPGDTESTQARFVAFRMGQAEKIAHCEFGARSVGPTRSLPLTQLWSVPSFFKVSETLAKADRSASEERFLTSLQWAGRAQISPRSEEAFLLYAISLESLLLGTKRAEELGYRLRTRCARLVAPPERREETVRRLESLYRMRSKIVHSGCFQVAESDLALIRMYCRASLFRVLQDDVLTNMQSEEEFEDWFERQSLGLSV